MRFKKTMSVMIAAAMLVSTFCAMGSISAGAEAADSVDKIVKSDYSTYTTYSGTDLGSTYTPEATTFKVWAPTSSVVTLKRYSAGNDTAESGSTFIEEVKMTLDKKTGVWSATVSGDIKNTYYTYFVKNDLRPEGVEVCDIYAKAAGVNGNRAMVVDLASTNPDGWDKDNFQRAEEATDASIWEVHVKDFSYDPESGVSEKYRGKYMAFTELQTTLNNAGDVKTCMNYLKDLGIRYVQINPMYDFASVDEAGDDTQFNWGYDPKNYNVPEGSYSTNPYDGNVRINEMKQMIKALHDNGIGVVMDVVYNHTFDNETSFFNLTVPDYYYRHKDNGDWSNGSGCGNDTASEREMFKKFMVESVTYWANEYHLDGFRFDLMGLHDLDTMNLIREELDKIDPKILTYGEGWDLGTATDKKNWAGNKTQLCTQKKASKSSERLGFFNDAARDAIKGKAFDDLTSRGFVSGAKGSKAVLYQGIKGQEDGLSWKTIAPTQNIMYSCCHDNQTLWDRLVCSTYGVENDQFDVRNEEFVSGNKMAGAIVMTSQGVPFILAGEEFARTKHGDHNSYKSSPDINMLDWSRAAEYADVVSYYKGLIQLRENFDAFSDGTKTSGSAMVKLDTPEYVLGYSLDNLSTAKGQWDNVVVYFNSSLTDTETVTLPGGSSGSESGYAVMGDMDKSGACDSGDSLLILRQSVGLEHFTDEQIAVADLDGDSVITAGDAFLVLRTSVGLEKPVPVSSGPKYVSVADDQTAGLSAIKTYSGTADVAPNSALILVPKDSYDKAGLSDSADAFVVVKHVDKDTGKVFRQVTIKGNAGQAYTTQPAGDLALAYDVDSVDGNASGKMTKGTTTVTYNYKPFAGGVGTLTVKYVDQDGKEIGSPTVTSARGGTAYTTSPKSFSWYKLDETKLPKNANGTYNKDGVEVVYVYTYNKPAKTDSFVTSTIHVKLNNINADEFNGNIYIWDDEGKDLPEAKGWPGTPLGTADENGWYSFTFQNYNVYNWILNGGGKQTADMSASGDIWVVADGNAANIQVTDYNPDK